jgi:osmotically-inducible protein OsmY
MLLTSASSNVAADNTARNVRDQGGNTLTATDQGGSDADRTVTQQVRQAISTDGSLSTDAHNVKIITNDGVVTLRGPVGNEQERSTIASKAKQVAGVKRVENQLEVATR